MIRESDSTFVVFLPALLKEFGVIVILCVQQGREAAADPRQRHINRPC
jgi:hypothetical protein